MTILVTSLVLVVVVLIYLILVNWDAKLEADGAPRTDMYVCHKHGAFPKSYTFKITELTDKPIEICPMCYEDRVKHAAASLKK